MGTIRRRRTTALWAAAALTLFAAPTLLTGCGGGGNGDNDREIDIREQLDSGDGRTPGGEYFDQYEFRARRDADVVIEMTTPRDGFDSRLVVFDVADNLITDNDDRDSTTTDARVLFRARRGEVYTVIATSFEPGELGEYSLFASSALEEIGSDRGQRNSGNLSERQGAALGTIRIRHRAAKATPAP